MHSPSDSTLDLCGKLKNTIAFSIVPWQWEGTSASNSATRKMRTSLSYSVNTIVADDLALQGTRASTTMVISSFSRDIMASALEGLTSFSYSLVTYCKTQQKSMKTGPPTLHYISLCHLDLREQLAAWLQWYIMHQESKRYYFQPVTHTPCMFLFELFQTLITQMLNLLTNNWIGQLYFWKQQIRW